MTVARASGTPPSETVAVNNILFTGTINGSSVTLTLTGFLTSEHITGTLPLNCALTRPAGGRWQLSAQPGQRATLSGAGWRVPVSIRAISASTSAAEDREARRLLGPGYVLDDAEEWAAVIVTYGGQTRTARSFLPPAEVQRLLELGLEETARLIEQGEE